MIRDPSDGTVREMVDEKPQSLSTRAAKLNLDNDLMLSTTSGLRQPTRTDAQERLEYSREWLKAYHARKHGENANDGHAASELPNRAGG